jgi:hypothetical protein
VDRKGVDGMLRGSSFFEVRPLVFTLAQCAAAVWEILISKHRSPDAKTKMLTRSSANSQIQLNDAFFPSPLPVACIGHLRIPGVSVDDPACFLSLHRLGTTG